MKDKILRKSFDELWCDKWKDILETFCEIFLFIFLSGLIIWFVCFVVKAQINYQNVQMNKDVEIVNLDNNTVYNIKYKDFYYSNGNIVIKMDSEINNVIVLNSYSIKEK